jgi:hypothetical protein
MPTLVVTPNPTTPSTVVSVAGFGFPYCRTRLLLDGSGGTTNVFRPRKDGTFNIGITVASSPRTQTLVAQQLASSVWSEKARTSIVVQAVAPTPPPTPPPPTGTVVQFPGTGPATPAALGVLMADLTTDIIEIAAGTYARWAMFLDVARPSTHPLLVRPASGAAVIWDGTGTDNTPPFRIGWDSLASYITFDPAGTGGSFKIQNYRIGAAGLVMGRYTDHITFNGVIVRGCYGSGTPQVSHCIYLLTDGVHRGQHWTSNDWDVVGPSSRNLCGFQTDTSSGTNSYDHVTANGWTVSLLHRAMFLWSNPTDVNIDGWTIANCNSTVDNYPNHAQGVVSNCHATGSGPLAPGSGDWRVGSLTDGGGNTAS